MMLRYNLFRQTDRQTDRQKRKLCLFLLAIFYDIKPFRFGFVCRNGMAFCVLWEVDMYRKIISTLPHSEYFLEPQCGKTIYAHQCCSAFLARNDMCGAVKECFYCVYAAFALDGEITPDTGRCTYGAETNKQKFKEFWEEL